MDIMLGNWASTNLSQLDEVGLEHFAEVLEMENPDLYKWLTGQQAIPQEVHNPVLRTLCCDLNEQMAPKLSSPSTASFEGKVWE
eukprot:CAMPEP_0119306288 /NCGR_PEP_ID=MMETSP1333-20130426/7073_1 /TAXON_ID=418940 /ORGANISM="Scyphosphaera apsteinii, Strain RCC1455" /LENGTH=83 /DNA_ID=CAMNT_0007309545 /DNA_START=223 /DNA_END=474 /DNA_ORIENTATION=+